VNVFSKDPTVGFGLALEDPTASGGAIRIVSLVGVFDETKDLPAAGWSRTKRGYKYRDTDRTRVVIRTGSRLKIAVRSEGFDLGGNDPAPVVVTLRIGNRRLCLEFPDGRLKAGGRRFVAGESEPPTACNEPLDP